MIYSLFILSCGATIRKTTNKRNQRDGFHASLTKRSMKTAPIFVFYENGGNHFPCWYLSNFISFNYIE